MNSLTEHWRTTQAHPDDLLHELADSEHDLTQAGAVKALADRAIASSLTQQDKDAKREEAEPYSLEHDSPVELARNPSVPASFLSTLVTSADQRIRTALASNPSLATCDIELLALDSNDSVRCELALRPDLPAQVTSEMAFDKSRFVRRNLASNPSCSDAAFKRLAADKDVYVRENLARNPALSSRASSWLLADTESRVFLAHADNTSIGSDVFTEVQKTYYKDSLASDKDSALKALLLLHPNCPINHLEGITITNDLPVRLAIALSPHTSVKALKTLTKDEDAQIAKIAQRRLSDRA